MSDISIETVTPGVETWRKAQTQSRSVGLISNSGSVPRISTPRLPLMVCAYHILAFVERKSRELEPKRALETGRLDASISLLVLCLPDRRLFPILWELVFIRLLYRIFHVSYSAGLCIG